MEKDIITGADIAMLKAASNKLNLGESVEARIVNKIIDTNTGTPKVVKSIDIDSQNEPEILDFPTAEVIGEGIKGKANIEAIKSSQVNTGLKQPFNLKKSFFSALDRIEKVINNRILNLGRIIYYYDELGRVYFKSNENEIFYINSTRTACINKDGDYAELVPNGSGYNIIYKPEEKPTYFEYLYISRQAAQEGKMLTEAEEESELAQFTSEDFYNSLFQDKKTPTSSKIVDLAEYRRKMEEQGPRR